MRRNGRWLQQSSIAVALLVAMVQADARAAVHQGRLRATNPLYGERLTGFVASSGKAVTVPLSAPADCPSYEAFETALRLQLQARATDFSLRLQFGFVFADVAGLIDQAQEAVLAGDDYLRFTYAGREAGWSGNDGDVTVTLHFTWLTTPEQEAVVTAQVARIAAEIITPQMGEEEREKVIHDWVIGHVAYETSAAEDVLRYTAYGALTNGRAVCQGYSLLGQRLLTQAGIPARIVPGLANGEGHAWNLVRICNQWYHLDLTWDDPIRSAPDDGLIRYDYYNRSDEDLRRDHQWEAEGYPAAVTRYLPGVCVGETSLLTWEIRGDAAFNTAVDSHRQVLLVAGRSGETYTRRVLDFSIQSLWPPLKPLVRQRLVVWFAQVDGDPEWETYARGLGAFNLPLICVVDPADRAAWVDRLTGPVGEDALYARLRAVLPAVPSAVPAEGWGKVKRQGR
jgi:hypothetical protein